MASITQQGPPGSHHRCAHSLSCHSHANLDSRSVMTPGAAKLYPRWMVLSLGGRAAWSFSLPQSIHTLPSLACSNLASTAWCSYFLP